MPSHLLYTDYIKPAHGYAQPAGEDEYFDFHVPLFNNYWACGMWHHNSGKSTLLQAISYGLYGRTRAERELQLINDQAQGDLVVELSLRFPDDSLLEITRGRTAKNEAILKVAGLGNVKPTDVAEHIADAVRLSYDDFIALTYFMQGDLHQFMEGNKRAYFQRWTAGLRLWQQYEAAAGMKVMRLEESIGQAAHEIARQAQLLESATSTKAEARAAKVEVQQAQDELAVVQDQVDALQDQYRKIAEDGTEAKEALAALRHEMQQASTEHHKVKHDLQYEQSALQAAQAGKCPVLRTACSQLLEAGANAREQHKQNIARLTALERSMLKELAAAKHRHDEAEAAAHSTYLAKLNKVGVQLKEAQIELREANARLRRAGIRLGKAKDDFDRLKKAHQTRSAALKAKERFEVELRRLQFVKYMCGRSGIPALLIESELERVEDRCNWVLERLDYRKRIRFSGYKELTSYEKVCPACGSERWHKAQCKDCDLPRPKQRRDEPTVTVLDGTTERPFALESGGAQVLQSFAVRLSGGLFVASMSGVPMRMVMLDEVFGMLDSANRQKLMALVIDKLASEFGLQQQFVVSHQEDVVNAVDDLLVVSSEMGSAVARWS